MSEIPTSEEGRDEAEQQYRRLSDRDSSGPSEAVRRAVLRHAAELAAQARAEQRAIAGPAAKSTRRRVAAFGGLAAAAMLAGLLVVPHYLVPNGAPVVPVPARPSESATAPSSPAAPPSAGRDAPLASRGPELAQDRAQTLNSPAAASPRPLPLARAESPVNPEAALRDAAQRGDAPGIHRFLEARLNINARDAAGRTALMLAVLHGRREAVEILLNAGADPNAADASGTTPLQAALAGAHPAIATILEQSGAR